MKGIEMKKRKAENDAVPTLGFRVGFVATLAAVLSVIALEAVADTSRLSCETVEGRDAENLLIDIENQTMSWGAFKYRITGVTSQYITAIAEQSDPVGGEVFVIDRVSGLYQRGAVYLAVTDPDNPERNREIVARTFAGSCLPQKF